MRLEALGALLALVAPGAATAPGAERPVTSTGSAVPRPLEDRFAEVVNVKDFGAACDWNGAEGTDDTAALQAAVNRAATLGAELFVPPAGLGRACRFSRLFFHYDAERNPGFPRNAKQSRGFTLRGAGPNSDTGAAIPANWAKSTLVSTDPEGPALNLDGGPGYSARQMVIEGVTVVASNSTSVIAIRNANTGSAIRRVTVHQAGTGGGIDVESPWVMGISETLIQSGTQRAAGGSFGLRMRAATGGGQVFVEKVTVMRAFGATGGFDVGMQIGATEGERPYDTQNIVAFECRLCTNQHVNRGMILGRVRSAVISAPYHEQNARYALLLTNRSTEVSIVGGYYADGEALEGEIVVDAATASSPLQNIVIQGNRFARVRNYGIRFLDGANTSGRISNNRFVRTAGGAGVAIGTMGRPLPWSVEDNVFDPFTDGGVTPIDDPAAVAYRRESTGEVFLRGSLSQQGGRLFGFQGVAGLQGEVRVQADASLLQVTANGSGPLVLRMPASREVPGMVIDLDVQAGQQPILIRRSDGSTDVPGGRISSPGYYRLAFHGGRWHWVKLGGSPME